MIQRIQTIFLLVTAGTFGALFKLPFATSDISASQFLSDKVFDITDQPILLGVSIFGGILALISIFLFKNRKVQIRIGYLIMVTAIVLPIMAFVLFKNQSPVVDTTTVHIHYQLGVFLPIVSLIFTSLANYYIRKDDKLVKSMDRLR